MWYRTIFKVIPIFGGNFPIDMLRYDGCQPLTEQDSGRIIDTFEPFRRPRPGGDPAPVEITLEKFHHGKQHHLTDERWRSFGWCVVPASVTTTKA